VIFGLLAWYEMTSWFLMLVIHLVGFVGVMILFLLPEEKQWRFIRAFAGMVIASSKNPQPRDYEIIEQLEALERQDKKSTPDSGV